MMICLECGTEIKIGNSNPEYVKCENCLSVFTVCGNNDDLHAITANLVYCPICGKRNCNTQDQGTAKFLHLESDQINMTKKWIEPINLGFRNCREVYSILIDKFIIFVSEKGQYAIYLNQGLLKGSSFKLNARERINKLLYNPWRIVILTNEKNLYQIRINNLYQNGVLEKIENRVDSFDLDKFDDRLAYSKSGEIIVTESDKEMKINEKEMLENLILTKGYIFFTSRQNNSFNFIVSSLDDQCCSSLTITSIIKPELIFTTSNRDWVSILLSDGTKGKLYTGKWKNLAKNVCNWNQTDIDGIVTDTLICKDTVYIQYADRIEVKELMNPYSGSLNKKRVISNLLPASMYLSADMHHITFCKRDTETSRYDASQVYFLSSHLDEEHIASAKADFVIHNYFWLNGHLFASMYQNNEYSFSTLEVNI
jgi:hypothetical protein